jgi:hypothetical protein
MSMSACAHAPGLGRARWTAAAQRFRPLRWRSVDPASLPRFITAITVALHRSAASHQSPAASACSASAAARSGPRSSAAAATTASWAKPHQSESQPAT